MRYMRVMLELQDLDVLVSLVSVPPHIGACPASCEANSTIISLTNNTFLSLSWIFIHIFNHFPQNFPVSWCLSLSHVTGNVHFWGILVVILGLYSASSPFV